jgi:hypothetical protein
MFSPSSIAQSKTRLSLAEHYQQVRRVSERLCQPLVTDYGIQSMPVLVLLSQLLPTLYPVAVLWNPPGESTPPLKVIDYGYFMAHNRKN